MKRTLTIKFERSVSSDGTPDTLEVVLSPVLSAASASSDSLLVGSRQTKTVSLERNVTVTFEVLPSYTPGLSQPAVYRLAWRQKFMGRVENYDFSMPDRDVSFHDLFDLDAIVTGESYLWVSDLGKPGRAAQLDHEGNVTNALGVPIPILTEDVDTLERGLAEEVADREWGDQNSRSEAVAYTDMKVRDATQDLSADIQSQISNVFGALSSEANTRSSVDDELEESINSKTSSLSARVDKKADLVGGKVPSDQLPSLAITDVVVVQSEEGMLALTSDQVQRGDIAMLPDSAWILATDEPFLRESWVKFNLPVHVSSVNGQTGEVVLNADSVGARSRSAMIPMNEVDGLATALSDRASVSTITGLSGRVSLLEDRAALKTQRGVIPSSVLDDDVPLYRDGQIITKSGRVIAAETSSMVTSINGKTGDVVLSAQHVGARPAGHVPMSEVTGLLNSLNDKIDTSAMSSTLTRMAQIESDLDALGSIDVDGVVQSRIVVAYHSPTGDVDDTLLRSPFGVRADGSTYYSPDGAVAGEAAFPYVTPNGNLELRRLDPDAEPDPILAKQNDLQDLLDDVATIDRKPTAGWPRSSLEPHVRESLSQAETSHTAISAATSELTFGSLVKRSNSGQFHAAGPTQDGHVANKAYVDQLAQQLTPQEDYSAMLARMVAVESGLTRRAVLDENGVLAQEHIPEVPQSRIVGLQEALDSKPTMTAGRIPVSTIPSGIPQSRIQDLVETLSDKADLIDGVIPTSQIPKVAMNETYVVTSRAEMLAMTPDEVQRGDMVIIRGTADVGSYVFGGPDHSNIDHWIKMESPGAVMSINGQTGTVTLSAEDVLARPKNAPVPLTDVDGLAAALNLKASKSELTQAIDSMPSYADVDERIVQGSTADFSVRYVATTPIGTMSGLKVIDGSTPPGGTRVLLTAEAQAQNNGVWIVSSSAWTRPVDGANGSKFYPKTILAVTDGATHAHSMWQLQAADVGNVGVQGQSWQKVLQGGIPKEYTAGNGITVTGTQISAKVGNGLVSTADGISLDPTKVMRKFAAFVPGDQGANVSIAHNLGTMDVTVSVIEAASGDVVLAGVTITSENTINVEFRDPPATNQYRVVVFG